MTDVPPPPPPASADPWPTASAADAWDYLEPVLARRHRPLLDDLRPGASDADLARAAATLGVELPPSFQAFYRRHDGQEGNAPGFWFGMTFLSLDGIVARWQMWQDLLADDPATYGRPGDSASVPPDVIDSRYIHPGWIPFADADGNHLGLDFAPGPAGTPGQCITFGRDQRTKFLVGRSFDELVVWAQPRFGEGGSTFTPLAGFPPGTISFDLLPPSQPDLIGALRLITSR